LSYKLMKFDHISLGFTLCRVKNRNMNLDMHISVA